MLHDVLLTIHIGCGSIGLVAAALAVIAPKRRGWHPRLGRVYLFAVAGIVSTALGLFLYRPAELLGLAIIAVATGTCAGLGFWMARRRPRLRRGNWFVWHLNLMSSSYISFVTAFVVQMTDGHLLAWILPTVIGSPLISWRTQRAVSGSRSAAGVQHAQ